MKILGIGNAIVDVLCKVSDEFLTQHSLTKSTMKLIDEAEFKKLLTSLKIEETISGGSVANSIVGLSQLGNEVGFIGKISNDELGQKYENGLKKEKVKYLYKKKQEEMPTGSCLILITPDSERTMCTFLGTAGKINDNISCSFAKIISSLFLTNSKKCGLCLSTQKRSDNDIATFFECVIALFKAFFGSPSSHK